MIATPDTRSNSPRPTFMTVLCEIGVMLLTVAIWAHSRGILLDGSWRPVLVTAVAGIMFGPVKFLFVLPERRTLKPQGPAWTFHLLKTAILSFACAVVALLFLA